MKNFIKSLERSGNESLIEAIITGYSVIFENNDADSINSGHKVMPETGTTVGDESLPLYRFVSGDNLRSGNDYGMHWTHSLKEIEQMASEEAGFIITAKHPGKSNVMDWENIKDRPMMEREIGGYEYRNNVFPEVPIRPNTKMDIISIVKVDADGNRTLIKGKEKTTEETPSKEDNQKEEFIEKSHHLPETEYNYRMAFPKVRNGWTKNKIIKVLRTISSGYGDVSFNREILKFDSPQEFENNLFYHGSGGGISNLKPSIVLRYVNNFGGGYDQKYWGISLSKDRDIASNFTGNSSYGNVAPVILKKNSKVIEMKNIKDADEIEDYIEKLWNENVDAVKIGDWSSPSSEQELLVINPKAIVVGKSKGFKVYNKEKIPSFDKDMVNELYNNALENYKDASEKSYQRTNEEFKRKYGKDKSRNFRKIKMYEEYVNQKRKQNVNESIEFKKFINSLTTKSNKNVLEAVLEGYSAIFEETIGPVYHGTGKEFYKFEPHQKRNMQMGFGIHFTPDPKFADLYKKGRNGRVIKANLEINKLFDAEKIYDKSSEEGEMLYEMNPKSSQWTIDKKNPDAYGHRVIDSVTPQRAEKILRKHGYDGVKYISKMQGAGLHSIYTRAATVAEAETYIVFDNSQIKQIPEESTINEPLTEAKGKSEFQKLEDNKVPLTDEERKEVFKKDAVWHYASSIDPNTGKKVQKVSAVWKSKHPKTGDITYITHTHRAYNTAKSLNAIINKYHNFIKGTA